MAKLDWCKEFKNYIPHNDQEAKEQSEILNQVEQLHETILYRNAEQGHVTCSSFCMNADLSKVLMVYHNIYQSFSWTGGHADGATDFLQKAQEEAMEETGISQPYPISGEMLSLDILPVKAHIHHGVPVNAHVHYNVTYGFIVSEKENLQNKPDENSAVHWIPIEDLDQCVSEAHMLPIYHKMIDRMREIRLKQQAIPLQSKDLLLHWYLENARDLPWRKNITPYHVWISEIMLQQTRVEAVKPYYARFLAQFPNIQALAESDQDTVNKCWEGLGYYSRARNLRKAAQVIQQDYQGVFPNTAKEIQNLPGIGPYTAGAIGSVCFGLATPAVDGNVLRVLARLTDCHCPIDRADYKKQVTADLQPLYDTGDCGLLTQAWMEIGATVCIPNGTPHCDICPLASLCMGKKQGEEALLPKKLPKKKRKIENKTVLLLYCGNTVSICQRKNEGLLSGLWEYPNVDGFLTAEDAMIYCKKKLHCKPIKVLGIQQKKHIFTHIEWNMLGISIACETLPKNLRTVTLQELQEQVPLPTAFRQFEVLSNEKNLYDM